MVKAKTIQIQSFNKFTELRKEQVRIGKLFGVNLSSDTTIKPAISLLLFLVTEGFLFSYSCFSFVDLVLQHSLGGETNLAMDFYAISSTATTMVMAYQVWKIFNHQELLKELFNKFGSFYRVSSNENWIKTRFEDGNSDINKSTRIINKFAYLNVIFVPISCALISLKLGKFELVVPIYVTFEWIDHSAWILSFNFYFLWFSVYYNRILFYTLTLFRICVHYIAKNMIS